MQSKQVLPFKEGHIYHQIQKMFPVFENQNFPGQTETDMISFMDPRLNHLGSRVICPKASMDDAAKEYFMAEVMY